MKTFLFLTGLTLLMVIAGNLELRELEQDQKIKAENRRNILDKISQNL
jgi:hypothetical protein